MHAQPANNITGQTGRDLEPFSITAMGRKRIVHTMDSLNANDTGTVIYTEGPNRFGGVMTALLSGYSDLSVYAFGAFAATRLKPTDRHHEHAHQNQGSQIERIRAGLRAVAQSPTMFPVTVLTAAIGVLYIGSFMVVMPVILREEFGGNVQQISTMQTSFWGGTIISTFVIGRIGHIVHRGRLIVGAVSTGATMLAIMSIPAPLFVLYLLVFIWGLGAGVMISMSRTTMQENAPPALRARILSIFQLGFTGGMSIGALTAGLVVNGVGARHATLFPAMVMAVIMTTLLTRTRLWHIRAIDHSAGPAT